MKTNNIELIFEYILTYDEKNRKKVELYQTKYEKYIFWGMFSSFLISLFIAIFSTYFNKDFFPEVLKLVSLLLLTTSLILGVTYEILFIYEDVKNFKGMTKTFLNPISASSEKDYEFSNSLMRFSKEELVYVSKRLSLEIEQMKKRISIFIGLIDKIGIIPFIVSIVLIISKNIETIKALYDMFYWLAYVFVGIYIIGLMALTSIPKIERYILLLDTAIDMKEKNNLFENV